MERGHWCADFQGGLESFSFSLVPWDVDKKDSDPTYGTGSLPGEVTPLCAMDRPQGLQPTIVRCTCEASLKQFLGSHAAGTHLEGPLIPSLFSGTFAGQLVPKARGRCAHTLHCPLFQD